MSPLDSRMALLRSEHGFTLIELLVTMIIGLIVSLAAFSILQFTTSDVSRITARAHVDQTGRVALEKIMLQLHSACVAPTINPIQSKSNATSIKFVSESSPLNTAKEPVSELSTVRLHEITYNTSTGILLERSWPSTGTTPEFIFNEAEAKTKKTLIERTLLTGVKQTESTPVFQYYRYYQANDSEVKLGKASLGQIDPKPMSNTEMETQKVVGKITETEAEKVAKVTMSFTLNPEGHESEVAKGGQPIALEDSAVLRLATSSESEGTPNYPCSENT